MALLAAAAIVGADLLGGLASGPWAGGAARGAAQAGLGEDRPESRALAEALLAGLPLGGARVGMDGLVRPPGSASDVAAHLLPDGVPRLTVPEAPAGPAPLRQALEAYAQRYGSAGADLAAAAPRLRLDAEAEGALARLVLAFVEASRLQEEATATLTPEEKALFSGLPDATLAWSHAHPEAGVDELEAYLASLAQTKVDSAKLAQAGDLLVRAVDLARVPLSRPPLPLPASVLPEGGPALPFPLALDDPWDLMRAAVGVAHVEPATAAPPNAPASLEAAVRDLAAAYGLAPAEVPSLPPLLHPTLDHAVALVVAAQAAGVRSGDSAEHAAAVLAAAEEAVPTLRAWGALLAPASASAPASPLGGAADADTDLAGFLTAALAPAPSPLALLAASRGQGVPAVPEPRPLPVLLAHHGLAPVDAAQAAAALPPQAAAALALLLEADLALLHAHQQLVSGLDDQGRAALQFTPALLTLSRQPAWSPAEAALVEAWARAFTRLDAGSLDALREAQAAAAAAVAAAAGLLQPISVPMSTEDRTSDLPEPLGGLAPDSPLPVVLGALDGMCMDFSVPGAGSDCGNDVFFQTANSGGILVTGPGSTVIDSRFAGGNPRIVLDLGGNDVYRIAAGGATNGFGVPGDLVMNNPLGSLIPISGLDPSLYGPNHQDLGTSLDNAGASRYLAVTIDTGGDDRYLSAADVAQGAALGLGTVGILWDRDGDDRYEQDAGVDGTLRHFQGMAGAGGLALLVDEGGSDLYLAPHGLAQGVGLSPVLPVGITQCTGNIFQGVCLGGAKDNAVAGTGLLLDLGPGSDRFEAAGGQGHGGGYGTVGVLLDEAGPTAYVVTPSDLAHQGGRGATAESASISGAPGPGETRRTGGLAALIDLGGAGDTYNAPRFPAGASTPQGAASEEGGWFVLRHPSQELRKGDDSLWLNNTNGLAIGIDSSLEDSDGDGFSDLAELLAQSNPHDPAQTPQHTVVEANRALANQTVDAILDAVTNLDKDSDGDGFPNGLETLFGSDPNDAGSTPGPGVASDPGFLLTLPFLCPVESEDACGGAPCDAAVDPCVSLLSIGGPGATIHARPAIVSIDLDGDDHYTTVVAGEGAFLATGTDLPMAAGSLSIDVQGDDRYDTPTLARTQAFASAGFSLLLDLNGTDVYRAGARSQASSEDAIALLADLAGDDRYEAKEHSQASHTGARARVRGAALLDLGGDDSYLFETQATLRGSLGGGTAGVEDFADVESAPPEPELANVAFAILVDATGNDTYESTRPSATGFETQGAIEDAARVGLSEGSRALFLDLGDANDTYYGIITGSGRTDLSGRKNDVALHANPAPQGAAAVFSDGLAGDDDEDGVPSVVEALAGSDPKDPDSRPLGPDGLPLHVPPPAGVTGFVLPGLTFGGRGNDVYLQRADLIVDLGGDDQYLAPGIGGTTAALHAHPGQPASAALLLDLGGNDTYSPEPYRVQRTYLTNSIGTVDGPIATQTMISGAWPPQPSNYGSANTGTAQVPPQLLYQPSLGAAVLGVAVLADVGGRNTFASSTEIELTADARSASGADGNAAVHVRAWGLSMGASLHAGVGVLATWDATNAFHAELTVKAHETRTALADPQADAFTLAQGASYGVGAGLLASFGGGNDTYEASAMAQAPWLNTDGGLERAYAQGAGSDGIGILLDDGGSNRFTAPAGFAQGSASTRGLLAPIAVFGSGNLAPSQALGLLWSGPGDDVYEGGWASQGSSAHGALLFDENQPRPGLGALLDSGGNDRYILSAPMAASRARSTSFCPLLPDPTGGSAAPLGTTACALSQGAAQLGGVGLLLDWAGDDRYQAAGRTHLQGAGLRGGAGALIDASGSDSYRAGSHAQGYAGAAGGAAFGLLADLAGRDAYTLDGRGQGYDDALPCAVDTGQVDGDGNPAPPTREDDCAFRLTSDCVKINGDICPVPANSNAPFPFFPNEPALFIDLGGDDSYRYGGDKGRLPADTAQVPADGNDWIWTQRPDATTGSPRGLGIDAQGLDEAVAAYNSLVVAGLGTTVELCLIEAGDIEAGHDCIQPDPTDPAQRLKENVTLEARVKPGAGLEVRRVTLLRDGEAMVSLPGPEESGAYQFLWDTLPGSPHHIPDGNYTLRAAAVLSPVKQDLQRGAAVPDAVSVASDRMDVVVDNAPTGSATLEFPVLPTGRTVAGVSPNVTDTRADLRILVGPGLDHAENHAGNGIPGATVNVSLVPLVPTPGKLVVLHDRYEESGTLRIDIDGHCGATRPSPCPDGRYQLRVNLTDPGGQSISLPEVPLFIDGTPPASHPIMPERAGQGHRIGANGLAVQWSATDGLAGVDQVTTLRLDLTSATVDAQDASANGGLAVEGSTTMPGIESGSTVRLVTAARDLLGNREVPVAADAVQVIVDFTPPSVLDLAASPAIAMPGVPVTLQARVRDAEGALDKVTVSVGDFGTLSMSASSGDPDLYTRTVTFPDSEVPGGEETPYVFTVVATDRAGNGNKLETASAMLDSRPPRPSLLTAPSYRDGGSDVPKGRPGATAQFSLLVQDFKVLPDGVRVDASLFGLGTLGCADEDSGRRWLCSIPIPKTQEDDTPFPDGDYSLPLNVTDAAGNVNATMALLVEVDSLPAEILDARVTDVGPDFIEVSWNTSKAARAMVQYGKADPPSRSFAPSQALATEHVVRVPGLDPASRYVLRPVATSAANVLNDTAALLAETTHSAFVLGLPAFPASPDWAGSREVPISVQLLLGTSPVSIDVKVQDEQRRFSVSAASRLLGHGQHVVEVDTLALPDGKYFLNVTGSRQGDRRGIESGLFRIDNTPPVLVPVLPRPGGVAAGNQPELVLAVVDPLRPDRPHPSTLQVTVDGAPAAAHAVYRGTMAGQARLVVPLPAALADGEHRVLVLLADQAGNLGEAEWTFRVDTSAPRLGEQWVAYDGEALRGRPGGPARVLLSATDLSGVSALAVDLRPWKGPLVPLFANSNGTWSGVLTIPASALEGPLYLPVVGSDANGKEGPAGELLLDVDATPPAITPSALRAASLTVLEVRVTTDELAVLEATADGRTARGIAGTTHTMRIEGLTPGRAYNVTLLARDLAGNLANRTESVRMPADNEPPGAPLAVRAAQRDGDVEVTWRTAADNAGIALYRVTRVHAGEEQASDVGPDDLRFLDTGVPPGAVTYRVRAIDVAGLEGPAAQASLTVLLPAVLGDGEILPRSGPADRPFSVRVLYSHPGGQPPDVLRLRYGNLSFPLQAVPGAEDCLAGCLYTANVLLPPLFTLQDRPETFIEAITAGQSTLLPVAAPLVTATGLGFHAGAPQDAPGLPIALLLAALVAAAAIRPRGRRR